MATVALHYTYTRSHAFAAAHAAYLKAPYRSVRRLRRTLWVLYGAALVFWPSDTVLSIAALVTAAVLATWLEYGIGRGLTAVEGSPAPGEGHYELTLDDTGVTYRTPTRTGHFPLGDLDWRESAASLVLFNRSRREALPLLKHRLEPAALVALQSALPRPAAASPAPRFLAKK